ncbi:type III pantothenate kinase [Candidatus Glomeribacter gigasporarum]|uniref:type III pantothenate kinase n=1 Tax=Candidatus Glomeribacter gigasporarum TaxID=132144 RepID=UPI0005B2B5E6|nr:type III pantothenate kinase [Candidatus Glomeribacter gigasporarum]
MAHSQFIAPFLLIDAGNTFIKWALNEADSAYFAQQGRFAQWHVRRATSVSAEPDWSDAPAPGSVWISNVAGECSAQRIETLIRARWPGVPYHAVRAQASQCGVHNGYREPPQLGSDRWASLIGARAAWPDESVLIAALGTAMTLDLLDANGYFAGGLIAPGGYLMMEALGRHTALLPTITPEDQDACATHADADARARFATDTQSALRAGCRLAQAALIERVWQAARQRLNAPVRCVLSGGGAARMRPLLRMDTTYCEHLVLLGLARIAQADGAAAML